MLSNEKRAHDLAIVMLNTVMKAKISEKVNSNPSSTNIEVPFDYYAEYKNLYQVALEAFNHDFPLDK